MVVGPKLHKLSIVVIDDNKFMRTLIESLCRGLGVIQIYLADSAEAGIELLRERDVDLLITDWHMEPMDGLELVKCLRTSSRSPNNYVPIIMLTGHGDRIRVCEARDAGVNMFMAKPVSAKAMYERLVWMINNPLPFIRIDGYFGPDRRRRDIGPPEGITERRAGDAREQQAAG